MLCFRQVNEFLDDNFDFRQVCSKTISLTLRDRSGRHSRDAAKRGCANGSHPWVRSRRRPTSDVDSIQLSTTEAPAGTSGEDQFRSRNLSSMHLQIPTPHHTVTDQKLTRSPRPMSRLQPARTWRLESMIAEFDFQKEIPRDVIWTYPRVDGGTVWESTETS